MSVEPRSANPALANAADAEAFFSTVWPHGPAEGSKVVLWTSSDKATQFIPPGTTAGQFGVQAVKLAQKGNVYVGISAVRADLIRGRGLKSDMRLVVGIVLDFDLADGPGRKKKGLFTSRMEIRALISRMPFEPTLIVDTGFGIQAWWCFKEPFELESVADIEAFERAASGWTEQGRRLAAGRAIDAVHDVTHVFRVPGTLNEKGEKPVPVLLLSTTDSKYNLTDFDPFAASGEVALVSDVDATATTPIVVRSGAKPPALQFQRLFDSDRRFRETWERKRDLPDTSVSAYDMALADAAALDGWEDQSIADLLVAAHEMRGEKLKQLSYYRCTVAKATKMAAARPASGRIAVGSPAGPYGDLDCRLWLTERGNGVRIARKLGGRRLIFVPGLGWHRYEGSEWVLAEELAVQEAMILSDDLLGDIPEILGRGGDADAVKSVAGWAKYCARPSTARATLAAASGLSEVRVVADELDRNPDLLNFRNGTVTLSTARLRPHDPIDHLTHTIPFDYDPQARCPRWQRLVEEVVNEKPGLVEFLPKALGYSLSARQEEQCLFFMRGDGSSGKSTLLDTVEAAAGRYVHRANETLLIARKFDEHPTEIADLRGRRIVITPEVGQHRKWNTQRIKNLVGERTLKGRYMRCDYFTFCATHHLWVTSNHFPDVEENTHAFWRRFRVIPFERRFPHNGSLKLELEAEIPGILCWLVGGFQKWLVEGLGEPAEVRSAVDDYRKRSDSLGLFLSEACTVGEGHQAQSSELFEGYKAFCAERGFTRLNGQDFKRRLLDLGHASRHAESGTIFLDVSFGGEK